MTLYNDSYYPQIFRTLDSAIQSPEDRAALAVKALEFLGCSRIRDNDFVFGSFNDAKKLIDAVESAKERDYLRRILLKAAQLAFDRPDLETSLDELLDQIEGDDERQNALYSRLLIMANNLRRADDYALARAELMDRVEELEDLRQYEDVVARVYATDRICGHSYDDAPLETPTGLLRQYDVSLCFFLCLEHEDSASKSALLEDAIRDVLRVLDDVEKTLDAGVRGTGDDAEELDADELDELRQEAATLVVSSPKILDHLPRLFEYAERRDAFDALLEAIELLSDGVRCAESTLFPRTAREYSAELLATIALATKLAGDNPLRLDRLAGSAMSHLRSILEDALTSSVEDDGSDPRGAALPSFVFQLESRATKLTAAAESDVDRVEGYAELLVGRARGMVKTLIGALAERLTRELDQLTPTPTRLYHKKQKFPILLRTCKRPEIVSFIESEDEPAFQRTLGAKFTAFDEFYNRRSQFDSRRLFDEFKVDLAKTEPLVAADEFLDFAWFVKNLPYLKPIWEESEE